MIVPKNISVSEIEELYEKIAPEEHSIEIPNGYKSLKIGLISRLSQFFITLAKQYDPAFNFNWLSPDDEVRTKNTISDPICLTAILCSDRIYGTDKTPIKKLINKLLVERFNIPIYRNGRQIQLIAIDHSIERYAKPECFYTTVNGKTFPRESTYYHELLKEFIGSVAKNSDFEDSEFVGTSELLAELIDNTDQHAKSDYMRGISKNSVRTAIINCHLLKKGQDLKNICGDNNPISNYVKSIKQDKETLHLLEISIFDSGPGLYKSFKVETNTSHDNFKEEIKIFHQCFKNGFTSKPNGIGVGRGLNKARLILNERKGYLSIRSGRLAVYRDFQKTPLTSIENMESLDLRFLDERTHKTDIFSQMKNVEGLSYTILVPLK